MTQDLNTEIKPTEISEVGKNQPEVKFEALQTGEARIENGETFTPSVEQHFGGPSRGTTAATDAAQATTQTGTEGEIQAGSPKGREAVAQYLKKQIASLPEDKQVEAKAAYAMALINTEASENSIAGNVAPISNTDSAPAHERVEGAAALEEVSVGGLADNTPKS